MSNKVYLTNEGFLEIEEELNHLREVKRPEVIKALKDARALGDLSENADYDAARDHQARVEARIRQLDDMLKNVEIIDEKKKSRIVRLGSKVTVQYLDTNEKEKFSIVGTVEADPLNGKLSNDTPLAKAIMDHKANDVCMVIVNPPYEVKILEVE